MAKYADGTIGSVSQHTVYYRAGGELKCSWRRVAGIYGAEKAQEIASDLARMGYRAIIGHADVVSDSIGLPIGWDVKSVDHERDEITIERDQTGKMIATHWTSHTLRSAV